MPKTYKKLKKIDSKFSILTNGTLMKKLKLN